jgi:hypothetical protein
MPTLYFLNGKPLKQMNHEKNIDFLTRYYKMLLKFVTRHTRKKQALCRTVCSPNVDIITKLFFNEASIEKNEKKG